MRRSTLGLIIVVALAGCTAGPSVTPSKSLAAFTDVASVSPSGEVVPDKVLSTVREWRAKGDRFAERVEWIETTIGRAATLVPELSGPAESSVYLIELQGHFLTEHRAQPPTSPSPSAPEPPFTDGYAVVGVSVGSSDVATRVHFSQADTPNLASIAAVHSFDFPSAFATVS